MSLSSESSPESESESSVVPIFKSNLTRRLEVVVDDKSLFSTQEL